MPPIETSDSTVVKKQQADASGQNAHDEVLDTLKKDKANPSASQVSATATAALESAGVLPQLALDYSTTPTAIDASATTFKFSSANAPFALDTTSGVKTDAQSGLITAITYPDSFTRTFDRDANGILTKIQNPNGSQWENTNGTWTETDSTGKVVATTPYGPPRVFNDGSYTVSQQDGTTYTGKPDGTGEAKRGDGSTVHYDEHGNAVGVDYMNGKKAAFTYDQHNQLTSVTDAYGRVYTSVNDRWVSQDGTPLNQNLSVGLNGDYTVALADGTAQTYNTDGSILLKYSNGQIDSVLYDNGQTRKFEYDQSGNVNGVTETDGHVWQKQFDGKWHEYGTDNQSTGNTVDMVATVDSQGNYTVNSSDGSSEYRKSDGTIVKSDKNKLVNEIDYADGSKKTFKYNDQNQIIEMDAGQSKIIQGGDGKWYRLPAVYPQPPQQVASVNRVLPDGTIVRWDGTDTLTSTKNVWTSPNPGRNLYGEHSDNPLAAITPDAVKQGGLGDCYFMAAVASLAQSNPQAVQNMIHDNGNGTYTVTFPGDQSNPVTVDCPTELEMTKYAKGNAQNGMWANVIEKAHRVYTGDMYDDSGDFTSTGVELLSPEGTNVVTDDLSGLWGIGRTHYENVEKDIENALANHKMIVAGTGNDLLSWVGYDNDRGDLAGPHIYSITGYDPVTKTVTLRNPWGLGGDASEHKDTFTMSLDDFYNQFSNMSFQT